MSDESIALTWLQACARNATDGQILLNRVVADSIIGGTETRQLVIGGSQNDRTRALVSVLGTAAGLGIRHIAVPRWGDLPRMLGEALGGWSGSIGWRVHQSYIHLVAANRIGELWTLDRERMAGVEFGLAVVDGLEYCEDLVPLIARLRPTLRIVASTSCGVPDGWAGVDIGKPSIRMSESDRKAWPKEYEGAPR